MKLLVLLLALGMTGCAVYENETMHRKELYLLIPPEGLWIWSWPWPIE